MLSGIERPLNFEIGRLDLEISTGVVNSPPATHRGRQKPATNRVKWRFCIVELFQSRFKQT